MICSHFDRLVRLMIKKTGGWGGGTNVPFCLKTATLKRNFFETSFKEQKVEVLNCNILRPIVTYQIKSYSK